MKIVILGATSPVGSYLSYHMADHDVRLLLHGRDDNKVSDLEQSITNDKPDSDIGRFVFDYQNPDSVTTECKRLVEEEGNVDILINCSFGQHEESIDNSSAAEIYEFYTAALSGPATAISALLPALRNSHDGKIINIVADWGIPMHNIMTGPALYISGKYGAHGLGAGLQSELGKFKIRTTNIFPGIIEVGEISVATPNQKVPSSQEGIHPDELVRSVKFVIEAKTAHTKSIVLSPTNPEYNGL